MTDFKAKMHQIRFRLGLSPHPAGGAYSAPPDPLAGFGRPLRVRRRGWAGEEEGKEREVEVEGGKGRAPKLLLNQGPSEPCYATAHGLYTALRKSATGCLPVD